ncbi:MAG: Eco57I restriction-modification methylase domain-containing protein [Terriglobia bacterium]
MARPERQQTVLDILKDFRGPEPLKQLFWSELNYNRANSPLSRRGWNATAADSLAADPALFATGGDGFHIIHSQLPTDKLLMGQERPVVSQLLKDHPYALFVFSNKSLNRWHFLNVKYDDEVTKRRVFRRITVGPEERLRTASERIAQLDLESVGADLFGLSPLAIQSRHDEAFDVEPVTVEFYKKYKKYRLVFEDVEKAIGGIKEAERKRLYTQRLFNRLMFIAFIQKKGWLKLNGQTDYLSALWDAYSQSHSSKHNFYRDRLRLLFFHALNTANEVDIIGINHGGVLRDLIGAVPYLNGGLFEEDEDDRDQKIVVPDESIGAILSELFDRFNFTVTESTPLDVEVAVDPEMLGKIFEELVTGRHETGSYYTPKPVVSFMCREALKGYLEAALAGEDKGAIERFVDEHSPAMLRDAESVLEALRRIKVCDPACGSGAYLLGMLHELFDLRACLFANKSVDAISAYDRKLEIIQRNVYGVDIDPFAVNIARLRLWLSLAVEFEGDNPPPLPNLDYKVEPGDSLTAPDPSGGLEQGFRKTLVDKFLSQKAEFLMAHGGRKVALREQIGELKETITGWAHGKGTVDGFDWPVEFAEVFLDGGFDIVLTNPPYVRMELFKSIKPVLRKNFPAVHAERADLYCYFYARALELLRQGGMQVFISSNKWLRANYGAGLRQYLAEKCRILSVTDFGDLPLFQATAYPMIFVAQRVGAQGTTSKLVPAGKADTALARGPAFTRVKSLDPPYPDVLAVIREQGRDCSRTPLAEETGD